MTTVEILKEMAFTATETQRRALEDAISALSIEGDLISRQKVLETLEVADTFLDEERTVEMYKALLTECIKVLPSVDVRENIHGEWKRTYLDHVAMGERPSILYCSVCCQCIAYPTNFCPNCGADMRGKA